MARMAAVVRASCSGDTVRMSPVTLLRSIALKPGPRGDENQLTGEPHLLPDGKSVYIHTFSCGLYLVRDINSATPNATFVKAFEGKGCGVPILTGHYWLQPVPATHSLLELDISDAEHPREVSSVKLSDGEEPHWIAIESGRQPVRQDMAAWLHRHGVTAWNGLLALNGTIGRLGAAVT